MRRRILLAVAIIAAAVPLHAGTASAGSLEVGLEDEGLFYKPPAAAAAVSAWQALGVDVVRLQANWTYLAPGGRKPPRNFNGADPNSPRYRNWFYLDNAVRLVRGAGMKVMLTITGPGPAWTSSQPKYKSGLYYPDPKKFAAFATAVAKRYGASVDRYMVWNEPNFRAWLMPQNHCIRPRVCTPVVPALYRDLFNAAAPAIRAADPGSQVLFGELAPVGRRAYSDATRMSPMPFLRSLACVDTRLRPVRTGLCRHFKAITADGFAIHPHPGSTTPPDGHAANPEDAKFGDIPRILGVLNRLSAKRRLRVAHGKRFPMFITEFGYQTNPPDRNLGVSLRTQTAYLQEASYLAWRWSQVKELTFYGWNDEPVKRQGPAYVGWQSALRFHTGKPKPALSVFSAPFVIDGRPGSTKATLWGQVRPAAEPLVTLMVRARGARVFHDVTTLRTGSDGGFLRTMRVSPTASYRYRWTPLPTLADPDPSPRLSGIVDLAKNQRTSQSGMLRAAAALAG